MKPSTGEGDEHVVDVGDAKDGVDSELEATESPDAASLGVRPTATGLNNEEVMVPSIGGKE
jgi:hypothetical protein